MTTWPKKLATLTPEQERIRDDWMKHWLEQHMTKSPLFRLVEEFNHRYPRKTAFAGARTLEIGAGVGAHCTYEDLSSQEYHSNELRPELADRIRQRFPSVRTNTGDCQKGLEYEDGTFDRVIAIHVLEHLPDLPRALREIRRVLKPGGRFSVVIPCEGGLGYDLARAVSSKRLFEKRYNTPYEWLIKSEHVNTAREVMDELAATFKVEDRTFFPFLVPSIDANLNAGLTLS